MEFLSEFVVFLVECAFWYFVIGLLTMPLRRKMDQKQADLDEQIEQLSKLVHRVQVEKHGESYYWFDADSDNFLGQGKTTEEAVVQIRSRFPGHIFLLGTKNNTYKLSGPDWTLKPVDVVDIKT
jgi:hypothetical protein